MNIESVAFNDTADHTARSVTVKYFLSDPTNGNAAYNLVTSECTGTAPAIACANTTKFGNLRFYLAFQNMVGQSDGTTEFSAYNNGGNSANAYAYKGTNDGNNHFEVSIPVPDDTATAVAKGTARVVSIGQVKEHMLAATSGTNPRPEVVPTVLVNTVVPCWRAAPLSPMTSATSATARWGPLPDRIRSPMPSTEVPATRLKPVWSAMTRTGCPQPS
jgi:OmcA/MtrC family decaheme c-type cytochrome